MSIQEFTAALRDQSNLAVQAQAKGMLDKLVVGTTDAFKKGSLSKKASVLSSGKVTIAGKTVNLTEEFRTSGEKQGRTRLVLTEDDLNELFKTFNISSTAPPIALYLKFLAENFPGKLSSHYEIYMRDGSIIEKQRRSTISDVVKTLDTPENSDAELNSVIKTRLNDVIAVRGLNFSHKNTLVHVAHFIYTLGVMPGKSITDIEKTLSGQYDRGHVYAQTYGRAIISSKELDEEQDLLGQIIKMYKLLDEGSSSLNQKSGKYNELLVRAHKDFTSDRIAMNIQLQIKRDLDTGLGNRDTGDLSSYIRIVGFLQSLIKNTQLSSDGKRLLSQPAAVSLKEFEKSLSDLDKKLQKYEEQLTRVISKTSDPTFLANLRTSDSMSDYVVKLTGDILQNKSGKRSLKVTTPNISAVRSDPLNIKISNPSSKVLGSLTGMLKDLKSLKTRLYSAKTARVSKGTGGPTVNLTSLQALLDAQLQHVIAANMGNGQDKRILNYRTGRFAASAKVERLSMSKEGAITAFYTYMRNPYGTFSAGGKQQYPKTRDPKLLISQSIREIAATKVANRLRAVLV